MRKDTCVFCKQEIILVPVEFESLAVLIGKAIWRTEAKLPHVPDTRLSRLGSAICIKRYDDKLAHEPILEQEYI